MEIFDLMNLLLSFFITIITVIVVFYVKTEKRYFFRRVLISCICISLVLVFSLYFYLKETVNKDVKILQSDHVELNENLQNQDEIKKLKDSLRSYKIELEKINTKLKSYSKLIDVSEEQAKVKSKIKDIDTQFEMIDSYNEVLPNSVYEAKRKGERYSGETSSLILYPPTEMHASYLDFSLRFINDNMIKNIACICVQILKKNSDGSLVQLFEGYYKSRTGNNKIRIKNYLLQKNTELRVGYFWKNDFGVNDYPKYEYLKFSINP